MSQGKWTETHKQKHPESESRRKEKQRQLDSVWRFHIRRKIICGYELPDFVKLDKKRCERITELVKAEFEEDVEVVYGGDE